MNSNRPTRGVIVDELKGYWWFLGLIVAVFFIALIVFKEPADRSVKEGKLLSEGFSEKLPAEFRYLWQVGEESGSMDEVAKKLGDLFGGYAELKFKEFGAWLPRFVYALVCGLVIYYIFKNIAKIYAPVLTGF